MPGQVILKVDGKNGKIKESYVYGNGERILTKHYEYAEDGTRMVKEEEALAYYYEYNALDSMGILTEESYFSLPIEDIHFGNDIITQLRVYMQYLSPELRAKLPDDLWRRK